MRWIRDSKVTVEMLNGALDLPIFQHLSLDDGIRGAWSEVLGEALRLMHGAHWLQIQFFLLFSVGFVVLQLRV